MKRFKVKPFFNKRTKQISIAIPKKKLTIFKKGVPKKVVVVIKRVEW